MSRGSGRWFRRGNRAASIVGVISGLFLLFDSAWGRDEANLSRAIVSTGGQGLVLLELDVESGELTRQTVLNEDSVGMLATTRDGRWLFATGTMPGKNEGPNGSLRVYEIAGDFGSAVRRRELSSRGRTTCFVDVDPSGRHVFVSNFRQDGPNSRGSIVRLPREPSGEVGEVSWRMEHPGCGPLLPRQKASHPHSTKVSPSGRFVAVGDLGIDRVVVYTLDPETGKMAEFDNPGAFRLKPGSGPRHVAMHPDERFLYVINENAATVTAFALVGEDGKLDGSHLQTLSTLAPGRKSSACADLEMHPTGRFLYGSNRGPDDIVAYRIDPDSGHLTLIGHVPAGGKNPREFGIDPTGRLLLVGVKDPDEFRVFRIDQETGALNDSGHSIPLNPGGGVVFLENANSPAQTGRINPVKQRAE